MGPEETFPDADEYLDKFIGIPLSTEWERYCNEKNSKIAFDDIEKVMQMIQGKVSPKEPLFFPGIFEASASLRQ